MNDVEKDMNGGKLPTIDLPKIILGTSALGNLFAALPKQEKLDIVKECVELSEGKVVFDSAGKYGAGLALETLGNCLNQLNVSTDDVIISNKLAWVRTELKTTEPTFEPGVWKDLKNDAIQKISYNGMIECFEEGNKLLNGYVPQMVSVHDADEYLATAKSEDHAEKLFQDILDAYKALADLKKQGKVQAIGVGAKNWRTIQRIEKDVSLDWIMVANSMTIKSHPKDLLDFIAEMENKGVYIINSAVFHAGFLVGGNYYDYKLVTGDDPENHSLFKWRQDFFDSCKQFNVKPAEACVQFALNVPGVNSIALNTSNAKRVKENLAMPTVKIPIEFWDTLFAKELIEINFFNASSAASKK
ncbi:MAG: aldo/keto reductase [Ferruginibacter sp.]